MKDINLDILHKTGACSSLMISSLGEIDITGTFQKGTNGNVYELLSAIRQAEREVYGDDGFGAYFDDEDREVSYVLRDFAFIVAMTSHRQPNTERILEEIGFTGTERVEKTKNPGEKCKLWTIPVRDFLSVADKYGVEFFGSEAEEYL